jgi:hypothetical protein
MFTVRIEHGAPGERKVIECGGYEVKTEDDETILTLDGDSDEPRTINIERTGVAYVMNDQGVTVDVIRPDGRKKKR